ncbi:class I SAM-dependent methyltransferase [Paenibacillus agaridevorans]|nr:class I SAM-dependent methyltransferase [Paenibacillus agaridevorans]
MMNTFFDASVWEKAWKEDRNTAINKMLNAGMDPTRVFDKRAVSFNKEVFSEGGKKRTHRILSWIEGQNVDFNGMTVLDIGAASGGFSVAFAERGARVTAVEPNGPLRELLQKNIQDLPEGSVEVIAEPFEDIDLEGRGWLNKFDLVFVSMCPVITDWDGAERVLSCARGYCYISMPAGRREHSLLDDVRTLVTQEPIRDEIMEFAYLLHLLYLKGYSFESILSREVKTTKSDLEIANKEVINWLKIHGLPADENSLSIITEYMQQTYPDGQVEYQEGGRFGKVLIRLQDLNMYTRKPRQA